MMARDAMTTAVVTEGAQTSVEDVARLLLGVVAQKSGRGKVAVSDRAMRSRILKELDKAGVDKSYVNVVVTTVRRSSGVSSSRKRRIARSVSPRRT